MKILISSEFYHPRTGGAEIVARTIAEGMVDRGHSVTIATTKLDNQSNIYNGVEIIQFSISGNMVKGIIEKIPGEINRYISLLQNSHWDVIIHYAAQTWHSDLAFPILDKISAGRILIPCGFSGLTTIFRRLAYWRYFKKMPKWLMKFEKCIYGDATYLDAAFSSRCGLSNSSIIQNGIWTEEFDSVFTGDNLRKRLHLPPTGRIILNVSNHYELKGHVKLIQTFKKVIKDDTILIIVGNDPGGRTSCYRKCTQLSKTDNRISLLSNLDRTDVIRLYKACDKFILNSTIEFFPIVLLEAMYAGKPIASTKVGCITSFCKAEMINNEFDLATAIEGVGKSNNSDWINENKQVVINKYNWHKILDKYQEVILFAANKRKKNR